MSKADLPREVNKVPLDYSGLISTLEKIDGETIVVRLSPIVSDGDPMPNLASIAGELRRQARARYEDHEFAIGRPFPDRSPAQLGGGVLFLNEESFESAALTTFDGNDYFIITVVTSTMKILIQDTDSTSA